MDTGISSAVGWIKPDYASPPFRLVCSCYPSRFGDPKGSILRISFAVGFNPADRDEDPSRIVPSFRTPGALPSTDGP